MTVARPWGSWRVVFDRDDFKVKYMCIDKGQRLSLQRHKNRSESWVIVKGHPLVTRGNTQLYMQPEEIIHIGRGEIHRIEAYKDDVRIIEVQHGICDENDIERLEDDYERE
jgi:mannose-6-phosphate isomerase-like protein (cupin superfamily)|tara:strand:+ start:216 stop:548 length:333 start_codon:yes stop_codon:yes gene_type:complete